MFDNDKKLGFGLMRLPLIDSNDPGSIDIETTEKMVDYFIENGFNYFDTAWMYCAFKSENTVKEALVSRYPRDKYTIASKLHAGFIKDKEDCDKIFNEQRRKTGVDFFDYYLIHDVGEDHYKIYQRLECFEWLQEKKKQGLIKFAGFSFHDNAELLERVLNEHPEIDFVQLQINYLDWDNAAIQSRKCYEVATKHGKPVIVMEPVKGGTLAKLPEAVEKKYLEYNKEASISSWAIRFAASLDNVKIVLSGMSTMEQMIDNVSYMKNFCPLSEEEKNIIGEAVDIINSDIAIPCTSCAYCVDGCPKKIPIPKYFSLYNVELQESKDKSWTPQEAYYDRLAENFGKASECISCKQCEKVCPQHLHISDYLVSVAKIFENNSI